MSESQNMDTGVKTFNVGGVPRDLMFSAAIRFRLFLNVPVQQVQEYILSDMFKLNAIALLLVGKEAQGKTVDQIIDIIEEQKLSDVELEEIIGWVRKRTLNFNLKEAEETAKTLQEVMPQATELSSTLNGIQR